MALGLVIPEEPNLLIQQLAESSDLPVLKDILADSSIFTEPSVAIRYLGLCNGASMQIVRSFVERGKMIAEIYLCDKDPLARKVALTNIQKTVFDHPDNLSPPLRADILAGRLYDPIPQDVTLIDQSRILWLASVNLVVAIPDCQPFSMASNQL